MPENVTKTYKLTIKRSDNSTYWTEYSNNLNKLNSWLTEEMTRPYWEQTYTYTIVELDSQGNEVPL